MDTKALVGGAAVVVGAPVVPWTAMQAIMVATAAKTAKKFISDVIFGFAIWIWNSFEVSNDWFWFRVAVYI